MSVLDLVQYTHFYFNIVLGRGWQYFIALVHWDSVNESFIYVNKAFVLINEVFVFVNKDFVHRIFRGL